MADLVNHPPHYTSGPTHSVCGELIECIDVTETLGFNLGNAIKYLWRADLKGNPTQDLSKARWYIDREIQRRARLAGEPSDQAQAATMTREERSRGGLAAGAEADAYYERAMAEARAMLDEDRRAHRKRSRR